MSQSESLVEAIFTKCGLVYGRDFLSRWEGLNLAEVKADWRRELGALLRPDAVHYALTHLPAKPPHVIEFRTLCLAAGPAPKKETHQIPLTPEQIEAGAEIKRKAVAALKLMGSRRAA